MLSFCFSKLYPHGYVFKARGQIAIKGKGVMETYFLIGTSGRSITEPDDQFNELQVVCHPDQSYSRRENVYTSVPVNSVEKISFVNVKKQSLKSSVLNLGRNVLRKISAGSSHDAYCSSPGDHSLDVTRADQLVVASSLDIPESQSKGVLSKSTEL